MPHPIPHYATTTDTERLAWAYLSRVTQGPSPAVWTRVNQGHSAVDIAEGVRTRASWIEPALLTQTKDTHHLDTTATDLAAAAAVGARLVTPDDEEWPQQLTSAFSSVNDRATVFPHLKTYEASAVAPHALWVRGADLRTLLTTPVAIVGSRAATEYGRHIAQDFAGDLAATGHTIISGGALGIDTFSHEAALAIGGRTVMVSATGIDRSYPARNEYLIQQIAGSGAVISEYAPGVVPARERFLARNRLIAALSLATVLVESAWRSGSLNALRWAEALDRNPLAVPGPITSNASAGTNACIQSGQARMVTSAAHIADVVAR